MNPIKIMSKVFREPRDFFTKVGEARANLKFAFLYFLILSFGYAILSSITGILTFKMFSSFFQNSAFFSAVQAELGSITTRSIIQDSATGFVVSLAGIFVLAGLIHLWILLFKGKNTYTKSFEMLSFSYTPLYVLGWIPFLNIVGLVWSVVLLVIGTQKVHGIGKTTAILMYVIPLVVLFIVIFSISIYAAATGSGNPFGGGF